VLWEFNRFLPEKPCQTGSLAKRLLLMLIDVESSDAGVYRRGSVRRASGFVLTGYAYLIL